MELFVLFAPLIGGILAGFGWKILGEQAAIIVSTSLLFFACFVSWFLFLEFDGELRIIKIFKWMKAKLTSPVFLHICRFLRLQC